MGLLHALRTALIAFLACVSVVHCGGSSQTVSLRVFYRAFCPACQWFVGDPLLELIRNEQFRSILSLKLIPAAGMHEVEGGALQCEGGELECEGHRWQACVIDKDANDVVKYLGTIACIEGDESGQVGDWETKLSNCLRPEELQVVRKCYNERSEMLLREFITKEKSGAVKWMPYTIVEGKVLGSASRGVSLTELQTEVCRAYHGPKKFYPDGCDKLVGPRSDFPADDAELVTDAPLAKLPVDLAADEKQDQEEEKEMEKAIEEQAKESGKIRMDVYWRAFCPGCMAFISKPLLRLMQDEQFRDILDFRPVPAAGTFFDSNGNFVCNKGLLECIGHRWLSCVIEEFPQLDQMAEHLACLESKENKGSSWDFIINKCFSGDDHLKMQKCYDSKSADLLKKHIAQREKVELQWVPYVLVNGSPIGDARTGISYKFLTDELCKAYSGSIELRPLVCQPKRLRNEEGAEAAGAESEAPAIRPCPPKKTSTGSPDYKDAPGMGLRRGAVDDGAEAEAGEEEMVKLEHADAEKEATITGRTFVFPVICLIVVVGIAMRLSGGHKKHL